MKTLLMILMIGGVCYGDCPIMDSTPYKFNNMICMESCSIDGKKYCFDTEIPQEDFSGEIKLLQSELKESRKREEGLLTEVNLLQYQIDILTESTKH